MKHRRENVALIKQLIQERLAVNHFQREITQFLFSKGLAKQLIEEVLLHINGKKKWLEALTEALASKIKTCPGFTFEKNPKMVAFVGAAGVGKTTLVLKLADYYAREKNKKVALVTLDQEKGGAYNQVEKYSKSWKMPLFTDLKEISKEEVDLILIDTSGCNTYEPDKVHALANALFHHPDLEVHLALSAAAKEVDLYGALHQFSSLNPSSLLFTKFDETLSAGAVINLSSKVDIPISFVAYGYPLPGKVEIADPKVIAHKILTDLNQEQFHFLRSMAQSSL